MASQPQHGKREPWLWHAYAPPDGGIGDFCLARAEDGWHAFYIHREYAGPFNGWDQPGQERKIGHATSADLVDWQPWPPALTARPGHWDSTHLWAPTVARHKGLWYMLYTGLDERQYQTIGVAASRDLWHWEYPVDQPVIDAREREWANLADDGSTHCRDPFLFLHAGEWLCYYTAGRRGPTPLGEPVIGLASSRDMLTWTAEDCVLAQPLYGGEDGAITRHMESPCVFRKGDRFFLVYNLGGGIRYTSSDNPRDFTRTAPKRLMDGVYNFEILDVDTGLFAYANHNYWSCLRFARVQIEGDEMTWLT